MFTGIIEEKGRVEKLEKKTNLSVLKISCREVIQETNIGDSISVDGVCLTVVRIQNPQDLVFELMKETLDTTTLKNLNKGSYVNLERALKAESRLGGHFVTGHVDCVGVIERILKKKNYVEFQISIEKRIKRFLIPKGSVAVEGVSLTIGKVVGEFFSIYLIPYTLKTTTLGFRKQGDRVNIETDLLAKYILSDDSSKSRK